MLKKQLNKTKFQSEVNAFYKKNKDEILDILLFGSTIKGKERPEDIDILVIYKDKDNLNLNYELKKILEKIAHNIQITSKAYPNLFNPEFKARESFLEAYSFINKKNISDGLGYQNRVLFRYDLKKFNKSDRMRFYYALYGRNNAGGILKELGAIKFAETIVICPLNTSEVMKDFFKSWNIEYIAAHILVPKRIISIFNE